MNLVGTKFPYRIQELNKFELNTKSFEDDESFLSYRSIKYIAPNHNKHKNDGLIFSKYLTI